MSSLIARLDLPSGLNIFVLRVVVVPSGWAEADAPERASPSPSASLAKLRKQVTRQTLLSQHQRQPLTDFLLLVQYRSSRPFVQICPSLTRAACASSSSAPPCTAVHFVPLVRHHTDSRLGDCSYLNTCHRMETCRYMHWALETPVAPTSQAGSAAGPSSQAAVATDGVGRASESEAAAAGVDVEEAEERGLPPQWLNVDLSSFDPTVLGTFDVVVADPPWAIHQEVRHPHTGPPPSPAPLANPSHLLHSSPTRP